MEPKVNKAKRKREASFEYNSRNKRRRILENEGLTPEASEVVAPAQIEENSSQAVPDIPMRVVEAVVPPGDHMETQKRKRERAKRNAVVAPRLGVPLAPPKDASRMEPQGRKRVRPKRNAATLANPEQPAAAEVATVSTVPLEEAPMRVMDGEDATTSVNPTSIAISNRSRRTRRSIIQPAMPSVSINTMPEEPTSEVRENASTADLEDSSNRPGPRLSANSRSIRRARNAPAASRNRSRRVPTMPTNIDPNIEIAPVEEPEENSALVDENGDPNQPEVVEPTPPTVPTAPVEEPEENSALVDQNGDSNQPDVVEPTPPPPKSKSYCFIC